MSKSVHSQDLLQNIESIQNALMQSLQKAEFSKELNISRDGLDLLVQLEGQSSPLVIEDFFSIGETGGSIPELDQLVALLGQGALDRLLQLINAKPMAVYAQAANNSSVVSDAASPSAELPLARVTEVNGPVRVVRNGQELLLNSGDSLFAGDELLTLSQGQIKFELNNTNLTTSGQTTVTRGTVGENSKLIMAGDVSGQLSQIKLESGTVFLDAPQAANANVQIVTPVGVVQANGQGVGVNVNSSSGETTVLSAQSTNQSGNVTVQPLAGSGQSITVPTNGIVLSANASTGATTSIAVPSDAGQTLPITSLMSSGAGAAGSGHRW